MATFERKFDTKNFKKSANLVTLFGTMNRAVNNLLDVNHLSAEIVHLHLILLFLQIILVDTGRPLGFLDVSYW